MKQLVQAHINQTALAIHRCAICGGNWGPLVSHFDIPNWHWLGRPGEYVHRRCVLAAHQEMQARDGERLPHSVSH